MAAASGCGNLEVMGEAVLQRAGEVRELVASLLEWRDPVGVLSVTGGIEAGAGTGGTPPWASAVRNDLARARREGSSAVRQRLDEAAVDPEELLDQVAEGRGRALTSRSTPALADGWSSRCRCRHELASVRSRTCFPCSRR
jgi:hypothetical protein